MHAAFMLVLCYTDYADHCCIACSDINVLLLTIVAIQHLGCNLYVFGTVGTDAIFTGSMR